MAHDFDERYWEAHWRDVPRGEQGDAPMAEPNPHLVGVAGSLSPGTALDAGCGEGVEAIWLASRGWQVTAVDISADALARAAANASEGRHALAPTWLQADLSTWDPGLEFDLVTTHYAHPAMPQLEFYDRLCAWVAPGGTLLIVGHLHTAGHEHGPPAEASVTLADITARLDPGRWEIVTAVEHVRTLTAHDGRVVSLHDVVVSARDRA